MSTALAVAGVTAVLRGMLESWLGDQNANAALGGANAEVTAVAPDTIALTGAGAGPQLNLFLHQVSPNAGWRNVDLPSMDARGRRSASPPLAIDLHYLLTAYGPEELQAEVLLGFGMQLLHEFPVLDRGEIEDRLPATLQGSLLGRQVETIRIIPERMGTEELSKLWSALQAHFRPSAAYHVSVILIQPVAAGRSAMPVLKRGPVDPVTGRELGIAAQPDLLPSLPAIMSVRGPDKQPAAVLGQPVTVEGHRLEGASCAVRLEHPVLKVRRDISALPGNPSESLQFNVPNQPAQLPVGTYRLRALVQRAGEPEPRETNQLAFTILPNVTNLPITVNLDAQGDATVTLQCRPNVRPFQSASLILGSCEVPAEPHPASTGTLTFVCPNATPGAHLARLRVDGIDSLIVDRSVTPPVFLPRRVTIQ